MSSNNPPQRGQRRAALLQKVRVAERRRMLQCVAVLRMKGCERATRSLPPQLPSRIGKSLWFLRFFPSCERALASVGLPRLLASITCEVFLEK